ncbi:MAG: zinc-dependent metalloprotease [Candidatus Nanopelagicales bacterium]
MGCRREVRAVGHAKRRHRGGAAEPRTESGFRPAYRGDEPARGTRGRGHGRGGPQAIPTVRFIRGAFQQRRAAGTSGWEGLLRKVLAMDLKARQYAQGATFVRAVLADGGMDRLNQVWERPQNLPTRVEIENPQVWLQRL